jgi:hypothetical protein
VKSKRARHSSGSGPSSGIAVRGLGHRAGLRRSQPTTDGPGAGASPAASPRRRVGQGVVVFAIWPRGNRASAEVKIRVPRISARPAAVARGERDNFFGSGQAWVGESDCLGGRRGRLFRRWRAGEGSGRLRFGAAVCPGRDSDGDLLNPVNRHHSRDQKTKHEADAAGDAAIPVLPAPDAPRADAEQPGDAVLCNAERGEGRAEFAGHWRVACFRVSGHNDVAAESAGFRPYDAIDIIEAPPARESAAPGA